MYETPGDKKYRYPSERAGSRHQKDVVEVEALVCVATCDKGRVGGTADKNVWIFRVEEGQSSEGLLTVVGRKYCMRKGFADFVLGFSE